MFRRVLGCMAVAVLSLATSAAAMRLDLEWLKGLGGLGFVSAAAFAALTNVNICRCPTCNMVLRRRPDTSEFTCDYCRVVWATRGFGFSLKG